MSSVTRSASQANSKDSRTIFGNLAGAICRVNATPSATVVVVTSADELTQTSLYASSSPGQLMITKCAAGSTHHGKTADINSVTGTALTVDVDFSAILAAGDEVAVLPPLSVELFLNQGHTLNATLSNDYTKGLTETFDTHNTPLLVDVGGDVPFFQIYTSEGFARLLALAVGSYKSSVAGTHIYRPTEANDGTFTDYDDGTFYVQDGNGVVRNVLFGMFGSRLTLEFPDSGVCTGSISVLGAGGVREIGGSGKTFTTGANNYIRANFICDTGARSTFRGAFMQLGGSFGDALNTATVETAVKNMTVTIERGSMQDRTLGNPYLIKPEELDFTVTVTGTRILQNDTFYEYARGQTTDADPGNGSKTTTRMLIKGFDPADATKTFTIDLPLGVFSSEVVERTRGRFTENFEFRAQATLDANGCVSTTTPPLQATLVSTVVKNISTAL